MSLRVARGKKRTKTRKRNRRYNPYKKKSVIKKINELLEYEFRHAALYKGGDTFGFKTNYIIEYINKNLKNTPHEDIYYDEITQNFKDDYLNPTIWYQLDSVHKKPYKYTNVIYPDPKEQVQTLYNAQQGIAESLFTLDKYHNKTSSNYKRILTNNLLYTILPGKHRLINTAINNYYANHHFRKSFGHEVFKFLLKGENNGDKFYEIDKAEYAFMIGTLPLSYQIALLMIKTEKNLKITINDDELDDFS